jgi:hypothetical protein
LIDLTRPGQKLNYKPMIIYIFFIKMISFWFIKKIKIYLSDLDLRPGQSPARFKNCTFKYKIGNVK